MEQFIQDYGIFAIFLWAMIENDVVFIMTGVAIDLDLVHPAAGLISAILGSLVHDSLWFGLAHHRSDWIRSSRLYQRVGPYVERLSSRFGAWELFFCRFVYGTRNPSLVFWGVQRLPVAKFLAIDALGLTLWCSVLAALGYFLSDRAVAIIGKVKKIEHLLLGALAVAFLFLFLERWFAKRQIKQRLEEKK